MVERSQNHERADVWLQVRRWTRQHAMLGWPCPPRSRPRWRSVRRPLSRRQAARAVGAATCPLVRPRATPSSLHSMSFPTNDSMPAEADGRVLARRPATGDRRPPKPPAPDVRGRAAASASCVLLVRSFRTVLPDSSVACAGNALAIAAPVAIALPELDVTILIVIRVRCEQKRSRNGCGIACRVVLLYNYGMFESGRVRRTSRLLSRVQRQLRQ